MSLDTLNRSGLAMLAGMAPAPTAPRTTAAIVLDLTTARADLSALDKRLYGRDPDAAEDALWSRLEDRISDLRAELAVEVRRVTGVDLRVLEEAA